MPGRYSPVDVRPTHGGRLMSRSSSDNANIANYVTKRDWRRDLDAEMRREGYDHWYPNQEIDLGTQPFPAGGPVIISSPGIWGGPDESLAVKKGWTYLWVPGPSETLMENGPGGPQYTVATEFQALQDTIIVFSGSLGQAKTYTLTEFPPLTLLHLARRPNGKTAWIAGTPTTLYRYFGLDQGAYKEGNGTPNAYIEEVGPNTPYFDDNPGSWIIIGSGFTADAQRWEAVNINGWAIFNNGVDLPVTYRVEDLNVIPMYELRESGVAAVGTIAEFGGVLHLADISTIKTDALSVLFDLVGTTRSGANNSLTASQAGNTVTTTDAFFTLGALGDIGRTIIFDDGKTKNITLVTSTTTATVDGPAETIGTQAFRIRTRVAQAGSTYSGLTGISGSQALGSPNVTASAAIFNAGMAGTTALRYVNGWQSNIIGFTGPTQVTLDANAPMAFVNVPFYIVTLPETNSLNFRAVASAALFTPDMVGRDIIWNTGTVKKIISYVDEFTVMVDSDWAVPIGLAGIENPLSYGTFTDLNSIDRIQFRDMWSMPNFPRQFSPLFIGSITAGQTTVRLDSPVLSLEAGRQLLIQGAGVSGGQLIANVVLVAGGLVIALDEPASTTVEGASIFYADAVSSIVGFEDLQDDGTGIVAMRELNGILIIFKTSSIFLATFTGDTTQPYIFRLRKMPPNKCLFYKNTLILVAFENPAQNFLLFAGRDSFFRYDTALQFPAVATEFELCKNLFFDKADIQYTNWIFAADNVLTKEIFFVVFPFSQDERILAYDYLLNTISSSSMQITAGHSGERPEVTSIGPEELWFVMGTPRGTVLQYGLAYLAQGNWNGEKSIFYRRGQNPYSQTKEPYDSILQSGQGDMGAAMHEKDLRSFLPYLSSQSQEHPFLVELLKSRNVAEVPVMFDSRLLPTPAGSNLMPTFSRAFYFGFRLTVSGKDNPLRLSQWTLELSGVGSKSFGRRPV